MIALDLSTERAFARYGMPASNHRLDDVVGYLNTLFRRHLGATTFRHGSRSGEIYSARFSTEDAARVAMAWAEDTLSGMRLTDRQGGVVLTGVIGGAP